MLEKWSEHVEKWMKSAKDLGRSVSFEYWGAHEILERLSRAGHTGRRYFWFNEHVFGEGSF
ncbi:MAG: hypothetical protein MUF00_19385, partial [Gemmatimonadaceae bacterium]|nr:hypothetical protein [Gemmatimonadaceae bacterium]